MSKSFTCISCDRPRVCNDPNEVCSRCIQANLDRAAREQQAIKERVLEENKPTHCCPDWDGMEIRRGDDKMDVCGCDFSAEALWKKIGELEKDLNIKESALIRLDKSMKEADRALDNLRVKYEELSKRMWT